MPISGSSCRLKALTQTNSFFPTLFSTVPADRLGQIDIHNKAADRSRWGPLGLSSKLQWYITSADQSQTQGQPTWKHREIWSGLLITAKDSSSASASYRSSGGLNCYFPEGGPKRKMAEEFLLRHSPSFGYQPFPSLCMVALK